MSERLRAVTDLHYPADEESYERALEAVRAGESPRDDPDEYNYKHVAAGDHCDDLPPQIRDHWIEIGMVEVVGWPEGLPPQALAGLDDAGLEPSDIAAVTDEELAEIDGVGPASIARLREAFGGPSEGGE